MTNRQCTIGGGLLVLLLAACSSSSTTSMATVEGRSPCARLCEHLAECGPPKTFPGVAACTRQCEDDPRQLSGPCREPRLAYERCQASLSCADVHATADIDAAKRGPCGSEVAAVLACEPDPGFTPLMTQF